MKASASFLVVIVLVVTLVAGCAAGPNQFAGTAGEHGKVAGFWLGLWHGFIAPFMFVASLFSNKVGVYEVHNTGAWYNLGYLFGVACFFGSGGHGTARRGKRSQS